MPNDRAPTTIAATCQVELLGPARLAGGVRMLELPVDAGATLLDVVAALAVACPALVGRVIAPDGRSLLAAYIFNRNGRDFLARADAPVSPGDRLLLLASAAGG